MYDYIIIGAGSAGCVLANRLSADPAVQVLLLEAGPPDKKMEIGIPAAWVKLFKSSVDWGYESEPGTGVNGRSIFWPRGKTLGGSSSTNAQCFTRGNPADYDGWATENEGWSWPEVLPHFIAMERFERGASPLRGRDGPLTVTDLIEPNPLTTAFVAAVEQAGIPRNPDPNGESQDGASLMQVTQRNGRRCSAATAYLKPALKRPNLRVVTGAHVLRIRMEGKRAVGVEYLQGGRTQVAMAVREVILSGGAVNSPQILMVSGIGPADELRSLGIEPALHLAGVGQNLQDHPIIGPFFHITRPISLFSAESPVNLARYVLRKRGMMTSNAAEGLAFVRSRPGLGAPDLELLFAPVPFQYEGLRKPDGHGMTIAAAALQPKSRGAIRLRSADPMAAPVIEPNYFSDAGGEDLAVMVEGFKLARRVAAQPAFAGFVAGEFDVSKDAQTAAAIAEVIRATVQTFYHPVGTCRMGRDEMAVVDAELRVRGVEGLRVVDASVMPTITRGHTNGPTIMIAEKAAALIRQGSAGVTHRELAKASA